MTKILKYVVTMAALLLAAVPAVRAQVIGLNPTPIALYNWDSVHSQWSATTTTNTSGAFPNVPQAFTFTSFNVSLGQWVPITLGNILPPTGVTAGSYTCTNLTVDNTGRLTLAASGSCGISQLTGDATAGPGIGSQVITFATVNSTPGTCGDATHVCQVTTNAKGLTTSQAQVAISLLGINQLTGDVLAGPGTGAQSAVLATVNGAPGTCGDATHVCQVTTNGKGLTTGQTQVAISGAGGGGQIDVIANIAALRAYNGGKSAVSVVGYYSATVNTAPDGGGGTFVDIGAGSPSDDDGGVNIYDSATSHTWQRQIPFEGTINSAWFGVKGDNSTNNSATIQKGWDYMCASRAGKFMFQQGNIRYNSPITKKCSFEWFGTGWNFDGASYGTNLIYAGGATNDAIPYNSPNSIYTWSGDYVHDIAFSFAGSAPSSWTNALGFPNPQDSQLLNGLIQRVTFNNWSGADLYWHFTPPASYSNSFTATISDGTGGAPGHIMCVSAGSVAGNYLNGAGIPAGTFAVSSVASGTHPRPVSCTGGASGTPYYVNQSLHIASETIQSNFGSGAYYQNLNMTDIWTAGDAQFIGADYPYMANGNFITITHLDHENAQSIAAGISHAYIDLTGFSGFQLNNILYEGAADASPYLFAVQQNSSSIASIDGVWIEDGTVAHPMSGLVDFVFTGYPGPNLTLDHLNLLPGPSGFTVATLNFEPFVMDAVVDTHGGGTVNYVAGANTANIYVNPRTGGSNVWSNQYISSINADCSYLRGQAIVDPDIIKGCFGRKSDTYVNAHGEWLDGYAKGPISITTTQATEGMTTDAVEGRVFKITTTVDGQSPHVGILFQPTADMVGQQQVVVARWQHVTAQSTFGYCPLSPPFQINHNTRATSGGNGESDFGGNSCLVASVPHNAWTTSYITFTPVDTTAFTLSWPAAFDAITPTGTQSIEIAALYAGSGADIPFVMAGANAAQPLDLGVCTAAPTSGTYLLGDSCRNTSTQTTYLNVGAGSPGLWRPLAALNPSSYCGEATFSSSTTSGAVSCAWVNVDSHCTATWSAGAISGGTLAYTAGTGTVTLTAATSNSNSASVYCSTN